MEEFPDEGGHELIQAPLFKGGWGSRFDKWKTSDGPFFSLDGSLGEGADDDPDCSVGVGHGASYIAVDLPYDNSAYSMTIVLPNTGTDINAFAESMTLEKWRGIEATMHEGETTLFLPRFRLEWKRTLNGDLTRLGMGIAFTAADFTRMSPRGNELVIGDVIQKTFVDVDEEGTEAAAVTSVGVTVTSAPAPVRIDRPFLIAIRERLSGTVLFIGKIVKLPA